MELIKAFGAKTFSSLKVRNYRLYFIGQGVSQVGDWMQIVALGWLVLELTGSGIALGTVLALRFTPIFLGGPFGGILVERFEKRRILIATQASFGLLALILALLVFTGAAEMWMVYLLAFLVGVVDLFDKPTRQTFVHEMVGPDNLRNAVSLNSSLNNLARALGPLFAGALIATIGLAFCFLLKAFSVVVILVMLRMIRQGELHREKREKAPTDLLAGVRYAASVPRIKIILIAMALIGTLSYEFQVSLPLFAREAFLGGAADYAALLSAMGAGSVAGGLFAASRQKLAVGEFVLSLLLFGVAICLTAIMPTLGLAVAGMVFVGFFSVNLTSVGNTMIQLESAPHMRGHVMSLWMMAIFGSTLIGAPIIGFVGQYLGARWSLAVGGLAALVAAAYAASRMLRGPAVPVPAQVEIRAEEIEAVESEKI